MIANVRIAVGSLLWYSWSGFEEWVQEQRYQLHAVHKILSMVDEVR